MGDTAYKGSFNIYVENNLLLAIVTGAWNKKTALRYVDEFKQHVAQFGGGDWGQIVFLENWILGTPDIEPVIESLANWNLARNLKATAFVTNENSLKQYQLENMLVDKPQGYQRQYFSGEQEARTWLRQFGLEGTQR